MRLLLRPGINKALQGDGSSFRMLISSLEPEKAISGMGLLAYHLLESMVNPRATSRPLVSALIV
jgi:hypothetical protein